MEARDTGCNWKVKIVSLGYEKQKTAVLWLGFCKTNVSLRIDFIKDILVCIMLV